MTYNPYAVLETEKEVVAEMLRRINLPKGWSREIERGLRCFARHDQREASRLADAIHSLTEAYAERGRLLRIANEMWGATGAAKESDG